MSDLDEKEQNHVRTALRFLRRRSGTWAALSRSLKCSPETLKKVVGGGDGVSTSLAFRVARLADASIDDLLAGHFIPGACPRCGYVPEFTDEPTVVTAPQRQSSDGALKMEK